MKKHIEFDWPLLPGSISTAKSQCGKAPCCCKDKSPRLHGIYYRWTGFIEGKRTTKTVSAEVARECRRRIQRFKKLQNKIERLLRKGLANAPWKSTLKKKRRSTKLKRSPTGRTKNVGN